jgi:hypothetical protein
MRLRLARYQRSAPAPDDHLWMIEHSRS